MNTNPAASVLARLKQIAVKNGWVFQEVLVRYATERFLARLATSPFSNRFILKGGNLFLVWQGGFGFRPTMDTDFLYRGRTDPESLKTVFINVSEQSGFEEDCVLFDSRTITVGPIRARTRYGGNEVTMLARISRIRIPLHFDIGFGDRIWPDAQSAPFPSLLGTESPTIRIYPKEAAIAEKVHAMVEHGFENSRMKDFYDVWFLCTRYSFDFTTLSESIRRTFEGRKTEIPIEAPDSFSALFSNHPVKLAQWNGFLVRSRLADSSPSLPEAMKRIRSFILPVLLPGPPFSRWSSETGWL